MNDLSRLSLNQYTTKRLNLHAALEVCLRNEIPGIGVWRDKLDEIGLNEAARLVRASGLAVSSLCRGGFFPAVSRSDRSKRIADTKRAVDEATAIGADLLVLVCGGLNGCTIADAREMIADGIAEVLPHARMSGVKLGIEPLHPMFAADRSIICSLREANRLVHKFDGTVGVIVDAFHVWFESDLYDEIASASGKIFGFHVSDWQVPLPDILLSRSMMGDGVIELVKMREAVEAAGYEGPIEVEIFNKEIWEMDEDRVLILMKERYLACV